MNYLFALKSYNVIIIFYEFFEMDEAKIGGLKPPKPPNPPLSTAMINISAKLLLTTIIIEFQVLIMQSKPR